MKKLGLCILLVTPLALAACFGARTVQRSYFVLHGQPAIPRDQPAIRGVVRVENLDADSAYEKFQIVVRRSPYELRYSDTNVWAVKPNQMVSDVIGRTLADTGTFSDAVRVLGDTRPDFSLSGNLHALEIYDSEDRWYAHLSVTLALTRFSDGVRLWSYIYDQRKEVPNREFSTAVRALSELLVESLGQVVGELTALGKELESGAFEPESRRLWTPRATPEGEGDRKSKKKQEPLLVPEERRGAPDGESDGLLPDAIRVPEEGDPHEQEETPPE